MVRSAEAGKAPCQALLIVLAWQTLSDRLLWAAGACDLRLSCPLGCCAFQRGGQESSGPCNRLPHRLWMLGLCSAEAAKARCQALLIRAAGLCATLCCGLLLLLTCLAGQ